MEISFTPSKSTSTYLKSSSSSSIPTTPATRKSMAEVWEHISLPNLHHPAAHSAYNGGINLPDFIHKDPYLRHDPHHHHHHHQQQHSNDYGGGTGFPFGCHSPPPATDLSLKLGHLDQFLEKNQEYSARSKSQAQFQSQLACAENPSFVSSSLCKKRVHPGNNGDDDATDERRHKRLIKNRESATRSRARRQAYTDELEQKMDELKKENANLRRELEKVGFGEEEAAAAAPAQHHNSRKGHSLRRALTAPF